MNRPLFHLDSRLSLCASFVRDGGKLADIGTDHAYLPIWLVKNEKIASAIAADINLGPLRRAEKNIRKYHVEDRVSTRLSDGLKTVFPTEADDIVIAGMGGETIVKILSAAPWVMDAGKHLILQPMTAAEKLRAYLQKNGFSVEKERAAVDGDQCYSAMLARYQPGCRAYGELFPYIGVLDGATEESRAYLNKKTASLQKKAAGLKISGKEEEAARLEHVVEKLRRLALHEEKEFGK